MYDICWSLYDFGYFCCKKLSKQYYFLQCLFKSNSILVIFQFLNSILAIFQFKQKLLKSFLTPKTLVKTSNLFLPIKFFTFLEPKDAFAWLELHCKTILLSIFAWSILSKRTCWVIWRNSKSDMKIQSGKVKLLKPTILMVCFYFFCELKVMKITLSYSF